MCTLINSRSTCDCMVGHMEVGVGLLGLQLYRDFLRKLLKSNKKLNYY